MSKRIGRRSLAALLAAAMVFTTVPVSVRAAEAGADMVTEALTEAPAEEETLEKQTEEQAPEEKDGEENSSSYGTEEQAPENEEHSESNAEQTEDPTETGTVSENETGAADESVTEEGAEEATEETKSENKSLIEEEITEDGIALYAASDFTQSQAVDWINNQIGKSIDADGAYGAQCVDLILSYFDMLGVPRIGGNANQYASKTPPAGWQAIKGASIQAGDIVIWTNSPYGHVALAVSDSEVVEQNYNNISKCTKNPMVKPGYNRYQTGDYWGVWRPNFKNPTIDRIKGEHMNTGYSRVIPDGYYHIASSFGDQWWLTIADMSNDNGANVHLWDYSIRDFDCDEQLFYFQFIEDGSGSGFYKITNKQSGKCLDVVDASEYMYQENGEPTNVQQHEDNGNSAQRWAVREVNGGEKGILYTLQARCSGFCLDLWRGEDSLYNGANISICTDNGSPAQQWRLVPYAPAVGQTIEDGEYQIVSSAAENKAAGAAGIAGGSNVELRAEYKENYKQTFNVKYLGNGYYSMINKYSGLSLDVAGHSRTLGTNVWLWDYIDYDADYDAQKWIIQPCENGSCNIISKCNGLYLNLDGAGETDGENINMWSWGTGNTIRWKFVPYGSSKLSTPTSTLSNDAEVEAGTQFYLNKNGADTLYFTWDGTTPTRQSAEYSDREGLTIPTGQKTCTLKAFGIKEGCQDSDVMEITYTVKQKDSSGEEGGSGEEEVTTPEDDDLQEGVKWHYNEEKVIYKDLSQYGQITTNIKPKTYDGTPYRPVVKVTAVENGKTITLTEGPDYRVLYFNNIHAGTGIVTVKGNGVYKGTISRTFEIKKKSCKKLKVVTGSMLTGDNAAPKIYVYDGSILLIENKDYILDGITPNFTATKGTKQISVIAAQNSDYEGMLSAKITVYSADKSRIKGIIDSPENVKLSQDTYQYTGKACKPAAIVTVDGNTLTAGKDYTIKYRNHKDAGTAFATITGKGSYVGSVVKEFTIKSSNGEFTLKKPIAVVTYNGKLQKPKITVMVEGKTLKQNKDYTLSYANNLHATDSAKVIVRGKGNYAAVPTKVFRFTINPCHIKKASIKGGQGCLLITHAKHTLVEGVDYEVVYGAAVGKSKISVTIKAKEGSSFTGEITRKVKQQL